MNSWITFKTSNNEFNSDLDNIFTDFNKINTGNVTSYYRRDGRFTMDQIFNFSDEDLNILDGVILNLSELKEKYHLNSLIDIFNNIVTSNSVFWSEFIGPFCGLRYIVENDSLIAYGNQTGDVPLFYYCATDFFVISNDFNLIVKALKASKISYSLDENAALCLMTYGYMIDDSTLIQEIKRLSPGTYIFIEKQNLSIHEYYRISYNLLSISEEEAIEEVDKRFRIAVKRCFDKDLEYGYNRHLADMSGGLDSRMVSWVAKDLGYSAITNISYSQSESDEYKIASLVSRVLGNVFIHEQLDDASFLYDIDDIVYKEAGLAIYYGITGGKNLISSINMNEFGLEHTGQLGDVILGSYTSKELPANTPYKRYSYLLDFSVPASITDNYKNLEDFLINTRGFLGIMSTHLIRRNYTYAVSPFLDIDFLSFCMSLPMKYRRDSYLYWKWIERKYPQAAKIKSTRKKTESGIINFYHRAMGKISRETKKALYVVGIGKSRVNPNHMNPIQYWYDTIPSLRSFVDEYYRENYCYLDDYQNTKAAVKKMIDSSSVTDKLQALTVVAFSRLYFGESRDE